jgi:hypothetical protein
MSSVIEDQITSLWAVHSKTYHPSLHSSRRISWPDTTIEAGFTLLPSDLGPGAQKYRLSLPTKVGERRSSPALCTRRRR